MIININKTYRTKQGDPVEIYKIVDEKFENPYPVLGAIIDETNTYTPTSWTREGINNILVEYHNTFNLVEVRPYDHIKLDDPVLVWNKGSIYQRKRYFAGVAKDGKAQTFLDGATSWSSNGQKPESWDNCEKFTGE